MQRRRFFSSDNIRTPSTSKIDSSGIQTTPTKPDDFSCLGQVWRLIGVGARSQLRTLLYTHVLFAFNGKRSFINLHFIKWNRSTQGNELTRNCVWIFSNFSNSFFSTVFLAMNLHESNVLLWMGIAIQPVTGYLILSSRITARTTVNGVHVTTTITCKNKQTNKYAIFVDFTCANNVCPNILMPLIWLFCALRIQKGGGERKFRIQEN